MRILVTAGNTQTPIDAVRCLTNIFTGRTGARIALEASGRDHDVVLLTSHPETASDAVLDVRTYRTFDDLHALLAKLVPTGRFDAIIHSAAVSDYALAGIFTDRLPHSVSERGLGGEVSPHGDEGRSILPGQTSPPNPLSETERGSRKVAGKIPSTHPELWMRFVPTPKLVDLVRSEWGFRGILVKFKLEVGIGDEELIAIARKSRAHSDADLIMANTLDGYEREAFLVDRADSAERMARLDLPALLMDRIEQIFSATHGGPDVK
jgi:phosphopantothenoylcysteine synthetase/decarboxylase